MTADIEQLRADFIRESQELYETCGHISQDEAQLYCALPYAENLWN